MVQEELVDEVPGLDLGRVGAWLAPLVGGLAGRLRAWVIPGGRSNLTYVIADGDRDWVLRRPPLAHVLPTAHDMAREHRVIGALGETSIPVPGVVGLCEDVDVVGAPFYVMERVGGHVLRDRLPDEYEDSPATGRAISTVLIRTLAALHEVDPAAVGLESFGRPAGYLERQLRRWWTQWEHSATRELPAIVELRRRLEAGLPEQGAAGIVHGDYRLDNLILAAADPGRIAAILDWEMCTLGDPLADLGLLLVYWAQADDPVELRSALALAALTATPGFMRRDELVAEYARHSSRELGALEWYVALGAYKLAIVGEGINARYQMGMTVGEGFERFGTMVPVLVERALERAAASGLPGLSG